MIGVLSLLVVGGIIVAVASFAYGRQAARQAYDRLLVGAAQDIAESISIIDGAPVADLPLSAFGLLGLALDDRISYSVRGPDGGLLTGHETALPPLKTNQRTGAQFYDAQLQGEKARFVTVIRRFAERDYSGTVSVTVGQTLLARNAMAFELARDALIGTGIAGIALILSAFFVIRSAMRPLGRMASGLLARDPYDLTPMETDVPAEVAVMIQAVNRFMRRLDRQIGAMKNLIADTAHQLRTPVAAIRAQTELATEEQDHTLQQQGLERLLRRTRSLGDLLDQMLSRALVIHRTDNAPPVPVDLRDIALSVVEGRDHELLSPNADVDLVIGPDPVMVLADDVSLREAVKNMLGNALRHGNAPVRIGVSQSNMTGSLWVEDAGPGPSPEVMDRIGERFERSAASKGNSAGLGISIVRAVAEAFYGDLQMGSTDSGFRISLDLPLAERYDDA